MNKINASKGTSSFYVDEENVGSTKYCYVRFGKLVILLYIVSKKLPLYYKYSLRTLREAKYWAMYRSIYNQESFT
jgi:hypothetical protein